MKNIKVLTLLSLMAGLFLGVANAQAGEKGWMTDYDAALNKAKKEGKLVLVQFHGSDWCPPCIQLKKEVLDTKEFKTIADAALVLVDADFPRNVEQPEELKEHNQALARKFEIEGFPTAVLLDRNGKVLDKMVGFPRGGKDGFLEFITNQTSTGS